MFLEFIMIENNLYTNLSVDLHDENVLRLRAGELH